jgi:hypothetical protein
LGVVEQLSAETEDQSVEQARALVESGNLLRAWRIYAEAVRHNPKSERLLAGAADLWVTAVDRGAIASWPDNQRRDLEEDLILQEACPTSPPILAHRISAQHSSNVERHMEKAAASLQPRLQAMLSEGRGNANLVVMLLLLRSRLDGIGQEQISALHRDHFKSFRTGDLAIPYSVMFHRPDYQRNVDDIAAMVREAGRDVTDGSWPLTHLLLAYWLAPEAFADLPGDWSASAVRARLDCLVDDQELASARSLAARFDGDEHRAIAATGAFGDADSFIPMMDELAERRAKLATAAGSEAGARLESNAHRAVNASLNLLVGRAPALASLRRKPKVAICVSGQLRGFRQSFETWKRLLLPSIDATIFVSSWRRIGRAGAEPFRYVLPFEGKHFVDEYRAIGIELSLGGMQERYPSLFVALEEGGSINEGDLSEFYGTPHVHLDDDQSSPFVEMTNPEKMHCKIEHAFRMAEASGQQFDLIVRIRPDKPVKLVGMNWNDMREEGRQPRLYSENAMGVHYGALEIGDQFVVGGPDAARVYHETWSRAGSISRFGLRMFHHELTGHVSLAQMCWLHGVEVRRAPVRFGPLQDPEPISASAISAALAADSNGRMDDIDRRLIAANGLDLNASS